jgi:hypothetical protein
MKDAKGHGSTAHGTGVDQIGQIKTMPLNKLRPHGPTDPALVNKYRELIKSGAPITPILIDTNNLIWDGHHRYEAYKAEGIKRAPVEIQKPMVAAGMSNVPTKRPKSFGDPERYM